MNGSKIMRRDEARKMAEVLTWFADGEEVQFYNRYNENWENCTEDCAFDPEYKYRIKPKQREFWCHVYEGGTGGDIWLSKEQAEYYGMGSGTIVKVREVLDDE